jgi:hypothetical protein
MIYGADHCSISPPRIPPDGVLIAGQSRNLTGRSKFKLSSPYRHIFPRIENPFPKVQSPPKNPLPQSGQYAFSNIFANPVSSKFAHVFDILFRFVFGSKPAMSLINQVSCDEIGVRHLPGPTVSCAAHNFLLFNDSRFCGFGMGSRHRASVTGCPPSAFSLKK